MEKGRVKFFDPKKGFGFIEPDKGGKDVFVHFSGIVGDDNYKSLDKGDVVEYEVGPGKKGDQATNVVVIQKGEAH